MLDPRTLTNDQLLEFAKNLVFKARNPSTHHVSRMELVDTVAELASRYKRIEKEANEMWHSLNPEQMGR